MASLVLGAVLVATTVVVHRPMGMRLANVPLFSWSMLVGSTIWIATFGSVMAHVLLGQVSHLSAEGLVENFGSGIYWLLRGPAIYMVAIPVLGIAGDVLPAMTGRRLKHYGVFQGLIGAFAVLSFGAWAQLPSSVNTVVWAGFALAVALPILGLLGGLAESLRYGKAKINGALVCSLTSLLLLLGGAIGGVLQAFDTLGHGVPVRVRNRRTGDRAGLLRRRRRAGRRNRRPLLLVDQVLGWTGQGTDRIGPRSCWCSSAAV